MKFFPVNDVEGFFKTVDKCSGQVHIVSPEGDDIVLNVLNSKLSRILFTVINENEYGNLGLELKCDNPDDTQLFIDYLVRG